MASPSFCHGGATAANTGPAAAAAVAAARAFGAAAAGAAAAAGGLYRVSQEVHPTMQRGKMYFLLIQTTR